MSRRGCGKKTDQRFATVAAEEENQPLSVRGNVLREPKARASNLVAGQPDVTAIVARGGLTLERRDQRQESAAGMIQIAHRIQLHRKSVPRTVKEGALNS